ncbi:MAG: thermonuclease family protein [Candidatus Margulisbacteria bacterium]|jgi:micrococcal nuclease|nr:thermonuclease family protein [Candidatus Margulisiibacteriota bacterium]
MKRALFLFSLLLLSLTLCGYGTTPPAAKTTYLVKRVVDGDTIKLVNGETVRYIGVDTPETKHPRKPVQYYGKEASAANKKLVGGKRVRLEFDVQPRDKYGRLLAYVYVDDIFVNAWLIENGYAQVMTIPPNVKHQDHFLKLQREARENKRGLWK